MIVPEAVVMIYKALSTATEAITQPKSNKYCIF
jgi:hypothetical protein